MSEERVTWNQIYEIIADALGCKLDACHIPSDFLAAVSDSEYDFEGSLLGDKACSVQFDTSKIRRTVPEFTVSVRADQGIRQTVAHILAHPELQIEDPAFDTWCDRVISAYRQLEDMLKHE